jgi:phosphoribosylformylglycinamidine synthase
MFMGSFSLKIRGFSFQLQQLRDNPECAKSEFKTIDKSNTGLFSKLAFNPKELTITNTTERPRVAILREQGVNGHVEMAAAFALAGFNAVDVHMNDLLSGQTTLTNFVGLIACGGFSYGDVLGAGRGWANSILFNSKLKEEFTNFFNRSETFSLGVCNGCQMLAHLRDIIPGAAHFPLFQQNISSQFEARLTMVQINNSSSILLQDMQHSQLPVVVSHGEGLAIYENPPTPNTIALQYIDYNGRPTEVYPYNPNGSTHGITGITSIDGRCTIMMPHPERVFRTTQMSWHDKSWGEMSPWFKLFKNAYNFVK